MSNMEQKFQTSFIPKKPIIGTMAGSSIQKLAPEPRSIFMTIAIVVFVLSLASVGAAYGWKAYLQSVQKDYKTELNNRESEFNIKDIERLKHINVQIDTAKNLVNNHLSASAVFDLISKFTIEKVRFLSLDLSQDAGNSGDLSLKLQGEGTSLTALAFQSQVLGSLEEYNLRSSVKNPIMSDPVKQLDGSYSFEFSASIDRDALSYKKTVLGEPILNSTTTEATLNSSTTDQ